MSPSPENALYFELHRQLEAGRPVILATIVRSWGSTPREVGARMLILEDGSIRGTVGGGCGEAEVWQAAMELFEEGGAKLVQVDLTDSPESDSGKVCGGRQEVLVEHWDASRAELAAAISRALQGKESRWLATVLGRPGPPLWKTGVEPEPTALPVATRWLEQFNDPGLDWQDQTYQTVTFEGEQLECFVERLAPPPRLVIAGAGHIARPLCRMGALCGLAVVVVDDRPDYAEPKFFPEAADIICCPFEDFFRRSFGTDDYIVLVTRGHRHDEDCLRCLVGAQLGYLGMIGSKRRIRAVFDDLTSEGVSADWLGQVYAPIGLDIGARTPEEIAVCILAEIIQVRRRGEASVLSLSTGNRTRVCERN